MGETPPERRALLMLLARFNLTDAQALRWYQPTERTKAGIVLNDAEILGNPYLIYEEDRLQTDPVAFEIVDRGIFPRVNTYGISAARAKSRTRIHR